MKKWLVLVLLVMVTAGTFVPCCSIDNCCADQVTNTTDQDEHRNEGACSPFCACATCTGSVELAKPIRLAEPFVEKPVHHQAMVKFNLPVYSPSFWQPPRSC